MKKQFEVLSKNEMKVWAGNGTGTGTGDTNATKGSQVWISGGISSEDDWEAPVA